ncbi:MAG TPA: hypothetical protein VHK69_09135 [Chitinophagaceae bacterium]|jgi:hypothetical protein|nr:hypothetical protein [Chitinophagaceae bacterium]
MEEALSTYAAQADFIRWAVGKHYSDLRKYLEVHLYAGANPYSDAEGRPKEGAEADFWKWAQKVEMLARSHCPAEYFEGWAQNRSLVETATINYGVYLGGRREKW